MQRESPARGTFVTYVRLARIDHWTKNVLLVRGVAIALFYAPDRATSHTARVLLLTLVATSLVASSNYVLNELLNAATDAFHPYKSSRPTVLGSVKRPIALGAWLALAAAGLAVAGTANAAVTTLAGLLWVMGLLYNVSPVRLKDWAYLDVLAESANNPIRLGLGWFAVIENRLPPFSLIVAYWMAGAFLMAVKRLAEYRELSAHQAVVHDPTTSAIYTEPALLASSVFYAVLGALFGGMFMLRYRPELALMTPLVAGLFGFYLHLAYKPMSAVQHPERLYREPAFAAYLAVCLAAVILLMLVEIPALYEWFTIDPAGVAPLWRIG